MISSDQGELVELAGRVLLFRGGTIVGELRGPEITEESIVLGASGVGASGGDLSDPDRSAIGGRGTS